MHRRATARITAFSPGQSPPAVRTPIFTSRNIGRRSAGAADPQLESRPRSPLPLTSPLVKVSLAVACAAALALASGCGDEQSRAGRVPGDTLTIFSSLPLQGPHADQAQSIVNAEKLALRETGGRAGDF